MMNTYWRIVLREKQYELFTFNSEEYELNNMIYSFNKAHVLTGLDSTIQHLEKCHCRVYGVRLNKSILRLLLTKDECTQRMFMEQKT